MRVGVTMEDKGEGGGEGKESSLYSCVLLSYLSSIKTQSFLRLPDGQGKKKILYGNRHVEKPENHPNKGRDNSRIK